MPNSSSQGVIKLAPLIKNISENLIKIQMEHAHKHEEDKNNKEEVIKRIKELPAQDRVLLAALNFHLERKKQLDDELEGQLQTLQQTYDGLAIPYYAAQNELALGTRATTQEELSLLDQFLSDEEKSTAQQYANEPLPGYWTRILKTWFAGTTQVTDKDLEVLEYLEKVEFAIFPPKNDFQLTFTFKENPHFNQTVLTKKFIYGTESKEADYPQRSEGTHIDWKEGKNVTVKQVEKKQKNKKTGAQRTIKKTEKAESFFHFFGTIDHIEGDEDATNQMDEDFEIAKDFIESILPDQLKLYLGIKEEEDDEFEDVDDEDGEDDKEDDDEEEDDTDDDKKKKTKKKAEKKSEAKKEGGAPQGECKQQ